MYKNRKILVIIPARGGSKGIPRKNIKLFKGKPLIVWILEKVLKIKIVDDIIVSSDSDEILSIVKNFNSNIILHKRDKRLSRDDTTIDEVVYNIVKDKLDYDIVVTIQPTSPLLTSKTIENAIKEFIKSKFNSLISVVNDTHIYWIDKSNIDKKVNYELLFERKNRQYLPKIYKETGGIIISNKDFIVKNKTRVDSKNICLFEIPKMEAIDIDDYIDFKIAEIIYEYKHSGNIGINVIGNKDIGLGHVYRQLEIAFLLDRKPIFFVKNGNNLAVKKIKEFFYDVIVYEDIEGLREFLKKYNINILINDILDTDTDFMKSIRLISSINKIINFEDMGLGRKYADIVINDLYYFSSPANNEYYGREYTILRQDVLNKDFNRFNKRCKNIVITCGGTDPNNLTLFYIDILKDIKFKGNVKIILGLGYTNEDILKNKLSGVDFKFEVKKNIKDMGKELESIDLALTSNGRTIYEVAYMRIPYISIAQNNRELLHTFALHSGGGFFLGRIDTIDKEKAKNIINTVINNSHLRKQYYDNLSHYDFSKNIDRVLSFIF